ncbi:MAG: DNA-directed RNA polymerase subunit beta' [Cytophagales bacterium]|nr:DNA-directed RNA polymerase subunit beta' [Cytophagales bacterium]
MENSFQHTRPYPLRSDDTPSQFSGITIRLASPDEIKDRSKGEVKHAETINYRSYKPEMKGLFCEKIFGPIKDWECHCGKYKRIRYRNTICDRCGVQVTEKKVRRERMGHIELVTPVVHIWYFRSLPNKIGYLLGIPTKKLDQIIYYERYVVIQAGVRAKKGSQVGDLLTEDEYLDLLEELPRNNQSLDDDNPKKFIAKMGGEAIEMMLSRLNLDQLSRDLRTEMLGDSSQRKAQEIAKRLRVVDAFKYAKEKKGSHPEWMVMRVLPVIPPEIRPLVPLDGGRFASSDMNDLYRRVIIRNNRLRRLVDIKAPEVILRNEKRMLQEAVDSLFDNTRKANAVRSDGNRALRSLSDILKGKQGRFRQNLLGKRVDYSGRSVIVVGPDLKMNECGLPKEMSLELFKPFVIRKLLERGVVKTVKAAKKIIDQREAVVWDILENLLKGHPVLLNRAPTLHRLGIQSFQPKLVEGKAIQLHPLACTAFNADFDGDQMAVHVVLGPEAVLEASFLMLSAHNVLNPANGSPITVPSQDMVLGLYYLTKGKKSTPEHPVLGEGLVFSSPKEVIIALQQERLSKHAHIKVRLAAREEENLPQWVETVAGRVLFSECVPEEVGFVNELLTKKTLQRVIRRVFGLTNPVRTARFLDDIKELGFRSAYEGGISIGIGDILVPDRKDQMIKDAKNEVSSVTENYMMGLITDNERYNQVIDVWTRTNTQLTGSLMGSLEEQEQGFNPIYMMMHSGARGSREQIRQLGGMRGLMAKPRKSLNAASGEIIENPILSNFREGLDIVEYFISTHGARKGLADTALKTADAGYLTRRLVDVAQDVIVREEDCGTLRGLNVTALKDNEEVIESISERILGRVAIQDVYDPLSQELIVPAGAEITEEIAERIESTNLEEVEIRSVLTCEAREGVCAKCYGRNLANGRMVDIGEAVGVVAAQSIGEPGTQLTLRTFHVGGTASNIAVDASVRAKFDGFIGFDGLRTLKTISDDGEEMELVMGRTGEIKIRERKPKKSNMLVSVRIPYGAYLKVQDGQKIKKGDELCYWDPYNALILSEGKGKVKYNAIEEGITYREEYDEQTGHREKVIVEGKDKTKNPSLTVLGEDGEREYNIPVGGHLMAADGEEVKAGDILVKIPRMTSKSRDITGGLPRVTELFEARNPFNPAVVSQIDGYVKYGLIRRGSREIIVEGKGKTKTYMVPLTKHILVQENDFVRAGSPLCDGSIKPSDILAIEGPTKVQEYLVNGIQEVYRLQGVSINDKHIEVIVRQMMRKVEIDKPGDTRFLPREVVAKSTVQIANDDLFGKKVITNPGDSDLLKKHDIVDLRQLRSEISHLRRDDKKIPRFRDAEHATCEPILQGITRAALDTESFISAASFQETTKVLSEAAIRAKTDELKGLKENVIIGHPIPAGTGLREYQDYLVYSKEEYEKLVRESLTREENKDSEDTSDSADTSDSPDIPDSPDNPDTSDSPDNPDNPDTSDSPDIPDTSDTSDSPDNPDTSDTSDSPDTSDSNGEDESLKQEHPVKE